MTTEFRLSPKVTLRRGDKIRVSGGPVYPAKSGRQIKMGERGVGTFLSAEDDGTAINVEFARGQRRVYIGPEYLSEVSGMIIRPHKIVKLRK